MKKFKTIKETVTTEIQEKKSRFIASIFSAKNTEEVEACLKEVRKHYYDARHHCYAYRILQEDKMVEKCSDDGEPSGTAGNPMLTILQKNDWSNVLVVVTRYFGGILLGTGGLVRAYSEATVQGLKEAGEVWYTFGYEMEMELAYPDWEMFKYYCKNEKIIITHVEYGSNIQTKVELAETQMKELLENLSEHKFKITKNKVIGNKYIQNGVF